MLKNYIKIALRNLWKNKGYSALNIFGLAIGITCASFIFLWVEDEVNFDQVIPSQELVFNVPTNQKYEDQWRTFFVATPGPLAEDLKTGIPEIAEAARKRDSNFLLNVGDQAINREGSYADKDIFDIYGLRFITGNPATAFDNKKSIVITEEVAIALFGEGKKAIGKEILVNHKSNFRITGIIENFPENTTYPFSWLVPFANFTDGKEWTKQYGSNFTDTFVKLRPGSDVAAVNKKVKALMPAKTGNDDVQAMLFAAKDWHLRSHFKNGKIDGGAIEYVHMFSLIAIIILLIACINFMNLATAQSEKRANEVGMRKALGSNKKQLIFQFITEAVCTALLSGVLSILLLIIFMPYFNELINKNIALDFARPIHSLPIFFITLLCGLVSGLYPAFYLSSFNPVDVLKGSRKQSGSASLTRKSLVVLQFSVSIVFIIGTIIVFQQVQHVKNRDLGLDKENLIEVPAAIGNIIKNYASIDHELKSTGLVQSTGLMNSHVLSGGNNTSSVSWKGKPENEDILISYRTVTPDFFKTTGMKIVDGKGFSTSEEADSGRVLVSQSFAKLMDSDEVVGQKINWDGELYTINGVVKDYLYGNMYGTSDPVVFFHHAEGADYLYIKPLAGADISKTLSELQRILKVQNSGFPFEYRFVDDAFNARFQSEQLVGNLARIFSLLAIIISCLGLFGLSAYMAEQRRKEIGVRKVLGSSVTEIVKLLSKDFILLVIIAIVLAVPIAWYAMNKWLEGYAYRVEIHGWIFAFAGVLAVLIALITVSFQAIKAAIANPVKSLRTE